MFSCDTKEEQIEDIIIDGEPYFVLNCVRYLNEDINLWECLEILETNLIQGDVRIVYFGPNNDTDSALFFCGKDVVLNSGNTIIDNLVATSADQDGRTCFKMPSSLGEFGWQWIDNTVLTINWIEQNELILHIPPSENLEIVQGKVYCRGQLSSIYCK